MLNHVEDQVTVYHFNKIVLMEVAAITGALSIQIVLLGRGVLEANVNRKECQESQSQQPLWQLQIQVNAHANHLVQISINVDM